MFTTSCVTLICLSSFFNSPTTFKRIDKNIFEVKTMDAIYRCAQKHQDVFVCVNLKSNTLFQINTQTRDQIIVDAIF